MNEDRDLLAEAAAHFARSAAFWRDLQFQREIELERLLDFLGERPTTRDKGGYHG
jgi:hypothetical protein